MSQGQVDLGAVWKWVTDQIKAQITMPALWRAMEAAVPITIEDDMLVVGFSVNEAHQAGMLTSNQNLNAIEAVLERGARRRLRLNVITGETLEEWHATKKLYEEAARLKSEHREQYQKQADSGTSWDAVSEQLVRRFGAMPNRSFACVQGDFLAEALDVLVEAYPRLMPAQPGELDLRNYSRCLDRVAERAAISGGLLAFLVKERLPR